MAKSHCNVCFSGLKRHHDKYSGCIGCKKCCSTPFDFFPHELLRWGLKINQQISKSNKQTNMHALSHTVLYKLESTNNWVHYQLTLPTFPDTTQSNTFPDTMQSGSGKRERRSPTICNPLLWMTPSCSTRFRDIVMEGRSKLCGGNWGVNSFPCAASWSLRPWKGRSMSAIPRLVGSNSGGGVIGGISNSSSPRLGVWNVC